MRLIQTTSCYLFKHIACSGVTLACLSSTRTISKATEPPMQEPWSNGYGWRLMFKRLWVWIPVPYTWWTLICCKNCNDVCLKRPKINEKEAVVGPFKKTTINILIRKVFKMSIRSILQNLHCPHLFFCILSCTQPRACGIVIIWWRALNLGLFKVVIFPISARNTKINCNCWNWTRDC